MSTTIKTASENQMDQIRRYAKKNKIYHVIIKKDEVYHITIYGLTQSESEKFIKNFIKTNHLTKAPQGPDPSVA